MDQREVKLQEIMQDQAVLSSVFVPDMKQTLANLAAYDIVMTEQELSDFLGGIREGTEQIEAEAFNDGAELSEDELKAVAGGKNLGLLKGISDANADKYGGTIKGANKSGFFYACGYTMAFTLNKIFK